MRAMTAVICWLALGLSALPAARGAQTIFSNNFETDTAGFTAGGVLTGLTRTNLPTDGGGLGSANESMWLGPLGYGVTKNQASEEIVDLPLTNLTPGQTYTVAFDLLVGASWDGAASGYGPDGWYFAVNGTRLVDTYFSNGDQAVDYGAYSPQRYSDSHYADPNGPDLPAFTGAEFYRKDGPGYSGYYGIYYFSHGAGNPVLAFTAGSTSATLEWARYSPPDNSGDSSDEYWALDNVLVTTLANPGPALTIRQTTTNSLVLSWPSPSTGFTLQENADLGTTNWVATTPQDVTDDGTNKFFFVNPAAGIRFYRLSN
jgi:hypothetical protein